jgi:hypothetical protein
MRSWDDIVEFYQVYARGIYQRDQDFGNGMLDLLALLRKDSEISEMTLGTSMSWLLLALPEYDLQSIHIQWASPDLYEIFLTPENDEPDIKTMALNTAVETVRNYLAQLKQKAKERH